MGSFVLGTAGHIDHGKTALVRALTGVDTDRLKEEQRRGITIELGFAELDLGGGLSGGVVDVPGHEAFVRAMVAGASGMDAALLVVAADEGPMPQTREHLAVLDYMGVRRGVVALTKADLVAEDWLELVEEEVGALIARSSLAGSPIIPTSVETGLGIDRLKAALRQLASAGSERTGDDVLRLPVDRAFTVRGTGTVVTGTVWSGSVRAGQRVFLQPAGKDARVRRVHVHGREAEQAEAGSRAAIALAGVPLEDVPRGSDVVDVDGWHATERITAAVELLASGEVLERGRRVRVHLGTVEAMARVFPLGRLGPRAWVELRLEEPVLSRCGDRLVLRSYSPMTTIGGGVILEPDPPRRKASRARIEDVEGLSSRDPVERIRTAVAATGERGLHRPMIPVLAGVTLPALTDLGSDPELVLIDDRVYARRVWLGAEGRVLERVAGYHRERPLEPGAPAEVLRPAERDRQGLTEEVLRSLEASGRLERAEGRVRIAGFSPTLSDVQRQRADALLERLSAAGLEPPEVAELTGSESSQEETQALLEHLVRSGQAVRLSATLVVDRAAVDGLVDRVRAELGGRTGLGPADFRPVADVSRRFLMPLLQHLDVAGVTVRRGDLRDVAV